jgi:predicted short-subunit dehydrogenase-like oxidoreductase (DUF2520 family)
MLAAMRKATAKRGTVGIVGPGRLGSALAINLARAGYAIAFLVGRPRKRVSSDTEKLAPRVGAKILTLEEAGSEAGLVWITVPDDTIGDVAAKLAAAGEWRGRMVFHSSGALTSEVLAPLRAKGARVASVHPGMTFVRKTTPTMEGVPFGVEGDAEAVRVARRVVRDLGGTVFAIKKRNKVLYHAFDAFASPMVIALMSSLEQVGRAAGIKRSKLRSMAGPLLRQTIDNYLEHGAAAALSGPLARGDVATVRRHLSALRKVPEAREAYLSLLRVAVKSLPVKNRGELKKHLKRAGKGKRGRAC